ncbi:MAG: hypothetical protein OXF40_01020 [Rhodospirillales bacterium]|nr:hypothetical protein [Rhodospirillales bacterium]
MDDRAHAPAGLPVQVVEDRGQGRLAAACGHIRSVDLDPRPVGEVSGLRPGGLEPDQVAAPLKHPGTPRVPVGRHAARAGGWPGPDVAPRQAVSMSRGFPSGTPPFQLSPVWPSRAGLLTTCVQPRAVSKSVFLSGG